MVYEAVQINEVKENEQPLEIKVTRMRWVIVAIFALLAAGNAVQWVQYSIIANVIMKYYGVTAVAVNWTSMICMATYPPLILPATYLVDKIGLRYCMLIASIGTAAGTWIKVFSLEPHLFWVSFVGQTIVFANQPFILGMPTKVAAVWFGSNQVSTACAIGIFGSQVGTALSFILPPLIVKNHDNLDDIGRDLSYLYYGTSALLTLLVPMIFFFFKENPEYSPSKVQAEFRSNKVQFSQKEFWKSYKSLLTNKPFLLLNLAYALNMGVYVTVCTILNQVITTYFDNAEKDAGLIGLLLIIMGVVGIVIFGIVLDKTKRFKETTVALYFLSVFSTISFIVALETYSKVLVYISGCIMGFFQSAFYSVGFEFCVELSFPQPEASSTGILLSVVQICGVIFILIIGDLLEKFGTVWSLSLMLGCQLVGCIITIFIPNILRRQEALRTTPDKKVFLPKDAKTYSS